MYTTILTIHSWLRWFVLLSAVASLLALLGSRSTAGDTGRADGWGLALMMSLDIQMLLGLLLYFVVSPNMATIRADFAQAMTDPVARFWAVEHITTMFVAVILVHVGRVIARSAKTPTARRTRLLICFGLATICMIVATPWPGMRAGRPLFRV